jgi:hypothetical protein
MSSESYFLSTKSRLEADGLREVIFMTAKRQVLSFDGTTAVLLVLPLGPRRLLTFALDGKASLPPSPPPTLQVKVQDNPAEVLDPRQIAFEAMPHGGFGGAPGRPLWLHG